MSKFAGGAKKQNNKSKFWRFWKVELCNITIIKQKSIQILDNPVLGDIGPYRDILPANEEGCGPQSATSKSPAKTIYI